MDTRATLIFTCNHAEVLILRNKLERWYNISRVMIFTFMTAQRMDQNIRLEEYLSMYNVMMGRANNVIGRSLTTTAVERLLITH